MIHSVNVLSPCNHSGDIQKLPHNGFNNRAGTTRMCNKGVVDFSSRSPALCQGNHRDDVQNAIIPERTVGPALEGACEVLSVRQH